jgi:hypothetical protein
MKRIHLNRQLNVIERIRFMSTESAYWSLPNEDRYKCGNCLNIYKHESEQLTLIQLQTGEKVILCSHCLNKKFLAVAVNKGLYSN